MSGLLNISLMFMRYMLSFIYSPLTQGLEMGSHFRSLYMLLCFYIYFLALEYTVKVGHGGWGGSTFCLTSDNRIIDQII